MNPIEMMALGATHIHWNPNYNGGFHEYFLPIVGDGRGLRDARLGVRLGEHRDHPVRVYLIAPNMMVIMRGVESTADLLQAYRLVAGQEWTGGR